MSEEKEETSQEQEVWKTHGYLHLNPFKDLLKSEYHDLVFGGEQSPKYIGKDGKE